MNFIQRMVTKKKTGPNQADVEEIDNIEVMDGNEDVRKKQMKLLGGAGLVALVVGSYYIMSGNEDPTMVAAAGGDDITIQTDDMVNRNMSEKEWMQASESRFQSLENQLKAGGARDPRTAELEQQLAAAQAGQQGMQGDARNVVSAYENENAALRAQLEAAKRAPPPAMPAPGPSSMYGAGAPPMYAAKAGAPGATGASALAAGAPVRANSIKLVSFQGEGGGTASRITGGSTSYTDSPNYLPPNAIAKAKVIVGVDASAGVNSQTDPMPVVLRITGPARSVYQNGRLLSTRIQGCLVNGAARGDLSSEKVYVKLQRMTCPQANGRFAVSEVKGFIAFGGKTGVRGRVVSREGGLVTQAFLAGLVGGFGRAFSANTEALYQGTNVVVGANGKRPKLGPAEIAEGGLGGGASTAGDMVSKYLIERAEQYQPVIEMPTGVDVEIVFLEGVFIQN